MMGDAEPPEPPPGPAGHGGGETLHATCVVVGESGILIRGCSGSGKSTLAREILDGADATTFARLVCDDRVVVRVHHGRLVACAVPSIAGRLEIRGLGLVRVPWEPKAVVRLVVDCDAVPERLPSGNQRVAEIQGVCLPRLAIAGLRSPAGIVLRWCSDLCDTVMTEF